MTVRRKGRAPLEYRISAETMRRAAELYLDEHLGYAAIGERLGLGRATIHKAIEQLREERACRPA